VNASGIASNVVGGLKSFGKTVASSALHAANTAERTLGGAYSALTGKSGWNGNATVGLGRATGLLPNQSNVTQSMISAPSGAIPTAYADHLQPTMQIAHTPSAQPSSSSTTVPASVLTNPMSGASPSNARTGNAFVPTSPLQNSAPMATSPATAAAQPATAMPQPAMPGTVMPQPPMSGTGTAVSPASLSAPGPSSLPSSSSFGAAVPQEALLRALASAPGRSTPSGYVEAPESLQFGARPRRKLPNGQ
jgi:hypothetical protein